MNKINHPENYEELVGNFSATYCESPCPPRKTFHIHEAFELMLMLSEGAELLVNNEAYPVPKGSLLMFGPTDLHLIRYSGKENYKRFVVWFKEEFLRELEPILGDLLKCFYIRRSQKENLITLTYDNFKRFYDIFSRLTECKSSSTLIQKLTLGELLASTNELKSNTQIEVSGEVEYADVYFAMRYIQDNISKKILERNKMIKSKKILFEVKFYVRCFVKIDICA